MRRSPSRSLGFLLATLLALATLLPSLSAAAQDATPSAAADDAEVSGAVDLDVLFIGAHPDDEAGRLSSYGQWNETDGLTVGVITITRGEGGGNAVGKEEGPALGLIREREERSAVGKAGIEHVYNLDKVDFYYTVSAPLTEETWGYDDTLARVVRVVRATKPEIIVTMNPAPTPGNHGHHQMAARFAVAAYDAAADPQMFPEQIETEGLDIWAPSKLFTVPFFRGAPTGETCVAGATPADPTDTVYGVWAGVTSDANGGATWAQIERGAQREYVSQGWGVFPDAPTDPAEIGCDYFQLIESRVPFSVDAIGSEGIFEGAVAPTTGGLPAGTILDLNAESFDVVPGQPFDVGVLAITTGDDVAVAYELPEGWTAEAGSSEVENGTLREIVTITPSEDADPATRYPIVATLTVDGASGQNVEVVKVAPPVEAHLEPLPQVAQFRDWVQAVNQPVLDSLIKPVASMGIGETRDLVINVTNNTAVEQETAVSILLAEGFSVDSDVQALTLDPHESTTVVFVVTNDDPALPTANQGGIDGDYLLDIRVVASGVATTEQAGLDLVPVVDVPMAGSAPAVSASPVAAVAVASPVATGPVVDGAISDGEYTSAPLDLSRVWEGEDPESAQDASGTAWLTWDENGIYVAVEVVDDTLGTVLPQDDAKRHWRTDSVEIAIDPLGTAENTSATFKVGVFPTTEEGGPAAYRDADAFQGPVADTAPGFEVASGVNEPYTGYVIETFIPYDVLPAPIDPDNMAMNIFIYDSDTEDLTGQTRLGWSTYRGVQGDPYRWGHVNLVDYTLSDGGEVDAPIMPLDVAHSVDSPQSIVQSAGDGVPLGGNPAAPEASRVTLADGPAINDGVLGATVQVGDADGRVHAFAIGPDGVIGEQAIDVVAGDSADLSIEVGEIDPASVTLAVSFQTADGAVAAMAVPVAP